MSKLSKTPAPKSERIYGSKVNPKGTSASEKSAKSIKFDAKTLKSIYEKVKEHNQSHPDKKVTISVAKAVVRRGMGAYSSTHRPTIKGGKPNSRVAWGLARLNAFLFKVVKGKSKSGKYSQDNDLLDELGIKHQKFEKGGEVGKIIAYHGTTDKGYGIYKYTYYTTDYEYAKRYAEGSGRVEKVEIKFNNPFYIDAKYMGYGEIILDNEIIGFYRDLQTDAVEKLREKGYDIIIVNYKGIKGYEVIPFNKKQVLVIDNDAKFSKGGLIAPNGKPSNLTPEQYKLVRTPEFKAWFGDWENDPENASKVVDSNGEPLVVYHGTTNKTINIFRPISYFTENYSYAKVYGLGLQYSDEMDDDEYEEILNSGKENVYSVFLNIRNILKADRYLFSDNTEHSPKIKEAKINGFDGMLNVIPTTYIPFNKENESQFLAFYPEQIKLADGTNTTFDANNPDIRYAKGGEVKSFYSWFIDWYKPVSDKINIMISLPNEISGLKTVPYKEKNVVILDLFEKIDQSIDAKPYLREILDKADEYGVTIYLMPDPRYKYIKDPEHKKKITRDYLIRYYQKFGFELTSDKEFMKRTPKYAKGGLIAPNGKPSNLTPEQYKLVRTPEFKAWFGDWENDPENASNVVDENGEPLVVYHGSRFKGDIYEFENILEEKLDWTKDSFGFYFTDDKEYAKGYGEKLYECFLNIRNPKKSNNFEHTYLPSHKIQRIINEGYDGVYFSGNEDEDIKGVFYEKEIVAFYPEQIKLADGSNTTFDSNNPDIRYDRGGEVNECIDYIKSHESIFGNGFYFDMHELSKLIDPYGQMPLNLDFTLVCYNSGGQRGLYAIDTINPTIVADELSKLYGLEKSQSYIVVHYFIDNAKRLTDVEQINTEKIVIMDRDKIVCQNLNSYKVGGELKPNTEKLIQELKKNSYLDVGIISTAKDGQKYRYDTYTLKYPSASYWLANLFEKAAQENGSRFSKQFFYGDTYSFYYDRPQFKGQSNGKMTMSELILINADGGEVDDHKETYKKWRSLVNMSKSELKAFYDSEEGKEAGLSPSEAKEQGIDSGRESARWIMRMKDTPVADWTPTMWKWAKKQISFISRMSGNKGGLYDEKGRKTRKHTSLLIWGHNPKKYNMGGEITDACIEEVVNIFNSIQRIRDWFVTDGKLVIVFDDELMVHSVEKMNYNLEQFTECHDVLEPEVNLNYGEDYKSIYINLKKDDMTIGKYADGGEMDVRMEDTVQRMDDPNFADISYYKEGGKIQGLSDTQIDTKVHKIAKKFKLPLDYVYAELKNGVTIEMEHTKDKSIASKIALDHLNESPIYYKKLKEMEKELEKMNPDEYLPRIQRAYANGGTIDIIYKLNTPTKEPTKLNYIQQVLVRTTEFKTWFGDWEKCAENFLKDNKQNFKKHYQNCSIVIDLITLEPQVVYHGTNYKEEFYQFDVTNEKGLGRPYGYFADNIEYSKNFLDNSQRGEDGRELLYNCFLNIRNPFFAIDDNFYGVWENEVYWLSRMAQRLVIDKYGDFSQNKYEEMLGILNSQIFTYMVRVANNKKVPFWMFMSKDKEKEFKYFLMSHGYDGVRYAEEFQPNYDVDNPAEFTKAWTIFDANQVKLADGRNIDFNPMTKDIRFEKGGDTNLHNIEENNQHMENNMSKAQQMRATLGIDKFAEGGHVKGDGKKTNDAKDGGFFEGRSHAEGGIKAVNKDTGQLIEVEGNEVIINKRSVADQTKREFEGKMMTNREILSKINEMGGGVSFEEGGEINEKNCKCIGKKYKFGGNLLSDYDIVKELTKISDVIIQPISDSVNYVDDLIKRIYK